MKKDEFIGYLTALKDISETHFTEDEIPELIGQILDKAKELELTNYTYPTYPTYPTWYFIEPSPTQTWSTCKFSLDNDANFTYNDNISSDFSIKCDIAPNFTVVK